MQGLRLFKNVAITLATLGFLFPQLQVVASDHRAAPTPTIRVSPNSILDVKLSKGGGVLTGRAVTHEGVPAVSVKVVVKKGDAEVGQSITDRDGNFAMKGLKSGVYQVASGATVGTYRVWTDKAAPPSAMPHCLLVMGENGARGQYGLTETIVGQNLGLILLASTTGLALAGLLIGIQAENTAKSAKKVSAEALKFAKSP